jgi:hypothetical protein
MRVDRCSANHLAEAMSHIARWAIRAYLRIVGAYIDRRHISSRPTAARAELTPATSAPAGT